LAPGSSYPPVTLTVDVASNAPASLSNRAIVSGGGDTNPVNNEVNDITTITPGPDLSITKTHTGDFVQGQTGATYSLTVTNQAGAPTSGTVQVSDSMPSHLLATAASGTGWNCTVAGSSVQCQRSDVLAVGASYPPIAITVNVTSNAPASVTNTAGVSGGGDVNAANNTASDPTTIGPGPDLTVTKTHTAVFTQGQKGVSYTITVGNSGGSPTSGTVTLIDSVPPGLIPVTASGTGWTCSLSLQSVTCTRADPLAAAASYPPVTLTVDIESNAPASVVNTATLAGGGDINSSNNTATDPTQISRGQDLTLTKSHTGNFTQGQSGATYTITLTNSGSEPTIGTVTLIDTVPTGLFPTAACGTGQI